MPARKLLVIGLKLKWTCIYDLVLLFVTPWSSPVWPKLAIFWHLDEILSIGQFLESIVSKYLAKRSTYSGKKN